MQNIPEIRIEKAFKWDGVEVLKYKEDGSPFKSITRQILFEGDKDLPCQLRYFDIAAGGYSTLERHHHRHVVVIIRGRGKALVGKRIKSVKPFDAIIIPPLTWHQFRATGHEPLGFLCLVNTERDKPQLPAPADLAMLRADSKIADFIQG
jgi:mannose-6-phosphate isomerase-like protein (cupin superfamily)